MLENVNRGRRGVRKNARWRCNVSAERASPAPMPMPMPMAHHKPSHRTSMQSAAAAPWRFLGDGNRRAASVRSGRRIGMAHACVHASKFDFKKVPWHVARSIASRRSLRLRLVLCSTHTRQASPIPNPPLDAMRLRTYTRGWSSNGDATRLRMRVDTTRHDRNLEEHVKRGARRQTTTLTGHRPIAMCFYGTLHLDIAPSRREGATRRATHDKTACACSY